MIRVQAGTQWPSFSEGSRKVRMLSATALMAIGFSTAIEARAWDDYDLSKTEAGNSWIQAQSPSGPSRRFDFLSTWFGRDEVTQSSRTDDEPPSVRTSSLVSIFENLDREDDVTDSLLGAPEWTFTPSSEQQSHGIQSLRLAAQYKGIPVIGGRVSIVSQRSSRGISSLILQEAIDSFDLSVVPSVSLSEASAQADDYAGGFRIASAPELRVVVFPAPAPARLVWLTRIHNASTGETLITWLDAHRGEWLAAMPVRLNIAPIQVYQADPGCQEIDPDSGAPTSLDLSKCASVIVNGKPRLRTDSGRPISADESSLRAAQNSRRVLQYFLDSHGRDSYDGKSSEVVNVVHIGKNFDNAFWDDEAKMMAYGDGDGQTTGDFTLGIDVAGHEMTHGVISATANLVYEDESGALNEAYADFFGKMIENENDWTIGKKLFIDAAHAEGFRDLKEPGRIQYQIRNDSGRVVSRPYPATVAEKAVTKKACDDAKNDNCYVHINATIPGHAFYMMYNRLGKRVSERILYSAITHFLSQTANFSENAKALRTACKDLYSGSDSCTQLDAILSEVGF